MGAHAKSDISLQIVIHNWVILRAMACGNLDAGNGSQAQVMGHQRTQARNTWQGRPGSAHQHAGCKGQLTYTVTKANLERLALFQNVYQWPPAALHDLALIE